MATPVKDVFNVVFLTNVIDNFITHVTVFNFMRAALSVCVLISWSSFYSAFLSDTFTFVCLGCARTRLFIFIAVAHV